MKDKKAVLGLDTAKLFVLAILALVIICVVALVVFDSIGDIQQDAYGGTLTNVSTSTVVNESGAYPTGLSAGSPDCSLTILGAWNSTNATGIPVITSDNYTISDCKIIGNLEDGNTHAYNNSIWNITGYYTSSSDSKQIVYNSSDAMTGFFEDAGTWFTLIGVVIIILIIAVVIVVINRFGGGGGAFSANDYSTGGGGPRASFQDRTVTKGPQPAPNI